MKAVKIILGYKEIDLSKILIQYSGIDFKEPEIIYKSDLLIENSPHYNLLEKYRKNNENIKNLLKIFPQTDYYKMYDYKGYRYKHTSYERILRSFLTNYDSIKKTGLRNPIEVSERSFFGIKMRKGYYEMWKGHHRAAAWAVLNYKKIKCKIISVDNKTGSSNIIYNKSFRRVLNVENKTFEQMYDKKFIWD